MMALGTTLTVAEKQAVISILHNHNQFLKKSLVHAKDYLHFIVTTVSTYFYYTLPKYEISFVCCA